METITEAEVRSNSQKVAGLVKVAEVATTTMELRGALWNAIRLIESLQEELGSDDDENSWISLKRQVVAQRDVVAAQERALKDVRHIAGGWIKEAPGDWGGDVQAECGRIILRYTEREVAVVSGTPPPEGLAQDGTPL